MLLHTFALKFNLEESEMPVDYAEVYAELEAEEGRLRTELEAVRAAKPAILKLRQHQENREPSSRATPSANTRFSDMGATRAIPLLLSGKPIALTAREIHDGLKAEGWSTESSDPVATVSATLSQLREKQIVVKVGEGWTLRPINEIPDLDEPGYIRASDAWRHPGS